MSGILKAIFLLLGGPILILMGYVFAPIFSPAIWLTLLGVLWILLFLLFFPPYWYYLLFFKSQMRSEYKIVGKIFSGPLFFVIALLLSKIFCPGLLSCDYLPSPLIIVMFYWLFGIGFSIVGISGGIYDLYKITKK